MLSTSSKAVTETSSLHNQASKGTIGVLGSELPVSPTIMGIGTLTGVSGFSSPLV